MAEIKGTLVKTLAPVSGNSQKGAWQKQDFVIQTLGQYAKSVCLTAWGERVNDLAGVTEGEELTISYDPESREYNNKWYTELRAFKIAALAQSGVGAPAATPRRQQATPPAPAQTFGSFDEGEESDLPF